MKQPYRIYGAIILALAMASVARAQQTPVLSASISTPEPLISAPEPVVAVPQPIDSASNPLIGSSRDRLRIVPLAAGQGRVADRQYWSLVGFTAASAVFDGETTMRGLQNKGLREMNPLLGSHPDRARFYATVGVADAGFAFLAYRLKRSGHDKLWKLPLLGAGAAHMGGGINNLLHF
ncbi:MAG: hypothetical protein WA463_07095 [Terriglobales bacterium]